MAIQGIARKDATFAERIAANAEVLFPHSQAGADSATDPGLLPLGIRGQPVEHTDQRTTRAANLSNQSADRVGNRLIGSEVSMEAADLLPVPVSADPPLRQGFQGTQSFEFAAIGVGHPLFTKTHMLLVVQHQCPLEFRIVVDPSLYLTGQPGRFTSVDFMDEATVGDPEKSRKGNAIYNAGHANDRRFAPRHPGNDLLATLCRSSQLC